MGTDTVYPALVQHNDLVRVHQRSNTLGNDKLKETLIKSSHYAANMV